MRTESYNVPVSKLPLVEEATAEKDFRSSFHWRMWRIAGEFVQGWQFLADFTNSVTFFGSARFKEGTKWYEEARKLARMLAESGLNVVTGGGPGIMEAGNQGAYEAVEAAEAAGKGDSVGDSLGLNIQLPFEQRINKYVRKAIAFHYFFVRKVMLSYYAQAYIYFPGGYGTLDEMAELITLIQTHKVSNIPIILVGKDFWGPLDAWIRGTMYEKYESIDKEDIDLYTIVDSAEEAFEIIRKAPRRKTF